MDTPSFQSPNRSETGFSPSSGHYAGDNASKALRPSTSELVDLRTETTHDDADLIALGKQLDETMAKIRGLYDPTSPDSHLGLIEAMLANLAPIEQAIMAIPARTIAGLGVKARHAAYVMPEYWEAPIDEIDWDAQAVRFLIEAVCDLARMPLSFDSNSKEGE
jgi:hypothetical protein